MAKKPGKKKTVSRKKAVRKVRSRAASPPLADTGTPRAEAPFLEEVLVALQKSFSRVNNQSAAVPEQQARALMVGDVDFQLTLNVEPYRKSENAPADRLLVKPGGEISLSLSGRIDTDIRVTNESQQEE